MDQVFTTSSLTWSKFMAPGIFCLLASFLFRSSVLIKRHNFSLKVYTDFVWGTCLRSSILIKRHDFPIQVRTDFVWGACLRSSILIKRHNLPTLVDSVLLVLSLSWVHKTAGSHSRQLCSRLFSIKPSSFDLYYGFTGTTVSKGFRNSGF